MCGKFLIVLFFISLSVKGEKKKEETETLLLIALLLFNELYVSASRPPSELVLSVKGKGRARLDNAQHLRKSNIHFIIDYWQ